MKAELLEKWACPICYELCDDELEAESHCPLDAPEPKLVCSECDEDFDNSKRGRRKAEEHLETHLLDKDGRSPSEIYLDQLREGNPPLGEWVTTMEAETEFLIPND